MHMAAQGCRRRPSDMCEQLKNPHDVGICRHGKGDDAELYAICTTISSASRHGQPMAPAAKQSASLRRRVSARAGHRSEAEDTPQSLKVSWGWTKTYQSQCQKQAQVIKFEVYSMLEPSFTTCIWHPGWTTVSTRPTMQLPRRRPANLTPSGGPRRHAPCWTHRPGRSQPANLSVHRRQASDVVSDDRRQVSDVRRGVLVLVLVWMLPVC